ncbi:ferredoxin [Smaragdicoccus niigatensis]|uniref:ferredoxin n=1 Tax=Smaragdicoccus niigatensis TaxID=359359 RepID=UPI0003724CD9|nr:ferredoxin [Smaragdicoccus niigatensis]
MRVDVDKARCEINGICIGIAPDVFDLDDNDELAISNPVPDALSGAVQQAVAQCPRAALLIVEDQV